jgi:hypothetical protein
MNLKWTTAMLLSGFLGVALVAQPSNGQDGAGQAAPPTPAPANPGPAGQPPGGSALKIAPGSVIPVQLTKAIDAKKIKNGEEVTARVTQDMKTTSGQVLVPKDTQIIGHVTEAQARSKEQKESQVGISFDHAVVQGNQLQVAMLIQAVIAPPSPNAAGSNDDRGPASPSTSPPMGGGARPGGGGGGSAPQGQQPNLPQSSGSSDAGQSNRPQITASTQGVIGMDDVKLSTAAQGSPQGSVLSSEKNNVKIEKGTLLLLKVE